MSFVMYARFGGLVVSQIHQPYAAYVNLSDGLRNTIKTDYWTPTNPSNEFPTAAYTDRTRIAGTSSPLGASTMVIMMQVLLKCGVLIWDIQSALKY
ncbi:MAG: hypothetical protein IPM85_00165 [Chitinophagaceae bacterium]|nr:hypothetical protein [Chitinophagaceae bacterium]